MKKRLLTLMFTLVLLVGIIAAVGMTASAAENYIANSNFAKTENDIIKNVFFSPNSDGTVNIGVNVDINHLDPQDINNYFSSIGYCYYVNDDNTLRSGTYGGINTLDTTFEFSNWIKDAKPGDKYRIKYYLSEDYYGDYEWEGYNFAFVEVIVPDLIVGEVEAVGTGIAYDSTKGAYAPVFTNMIAKDTSGNIFNYANMVTGEALYTDKDSFIAANKLTTAPVAGTTYYFAIIVDLYEYGVFDLGYDDDIDDNISLTIPGCAVEYYNSFIRESESYIEIRYKLTPCVHTYTNACDTTCNECSAERTITHKWTAATCTKAKTCSVCKATSGSALGHKWVAATCTKAKTCSVCKATSGKALGHTYKNVTTKATLTKNGKVVTKCSVCGNVSKTTTVYYPKTIKLSATEYTYNKKVKTPTVTVKDSKGNTLKKDTDYTVSYEKGRKVPGKYTVKITFKGKYDGVKRLYFTIKPRVTSKITASQTTTTITLKWTAVTGADGYRVYKYNTKTKKYEKLKDVTKNTLKISKLKAGTAYKYKVRAFTKDDGTIYGSYSDVFETATKCKTPSIKKLTTTKGKASFTWSNVAGESGYQVYYSTKKDSGYKKVASYKTNVVKGSKKKLKSGKKYYFKIRAYKKTASGTVYSAWSSVKSVKIK